MNNSCYDTEDYKAPKGLQNISPCQYSEFKTQAIKIIRSMLTTVFISIMI